MRRGAMLVAAGAAAAALALALDCATVQATSSARLRAAGSVTREVGHQGLYGPAPDRALVLGAWRDAGVDLRGLASPADLLQACRPLDVRAPRPGGPAAADYVLYRDPAGAERIGMFLSPADVAAVDGGAVSVVPPAALDGGIGDAPVPRLLAEPRSFHACRLAATRWPGGTDDTSVGVGRIALADPEQTAEHLAWAADHPRDADTTLSHTLSRILGSAVAGVVGTLEQLISGAFSLVHRVLEFLGPAGAPLLMLGGLLGYRFDARRLHAVLTGIALGVLAVLLGAGVLVPFGWVVVAAVLGGAAAAKAGVPVLGAIGGALVGGAFAVASFLTAVVTGVDGSTDVCVGTVLFALAADALWVRPLLASFGLAAHLDGFATVERFPLLHLVGGKGGSLDRWATVGDALALRPHALADAARSLTGAADVVADAVPVHSALSATETLGAMGQRGVDMLSLAWRPSSVSSDLVGHAADGLHFLDGEMRAGFRSWPRVREAIAAMDPERQRAVLDAMEQTSAHLVPQLQITARLSHLHSGARTLTGLATGNPGRPPWWQAWRSPVMRRSLRGVPLGGGEPAA